MAEPSDRAPAVWRLSGTEVRIYGAFFVLLVIGAFGYAIWSSWDAAGTVLLFLVAGLFAIVAGYLAFHERLARLESREAQQQATTADGEVVIEEPADQYLPHSSIWPLELGAGMTLTLLGFVLGSWVLVTGLLVTAHSIAGWLIQSRRRN